MARPRVRRVAMVTSEITARVVKETLALVNNGVEVDAICQTPGLHPQLFNAINFWIDGPQLRRAMKTSEADLFHVHNQPESTVAEMGKDSRPIVMDVHDLFSVLTGEIGPDEKRTYDFGDAFLHVSKPMMDHFRGVHGNGKPDTVIYNYVSRGLVECRDLSRYPGPEEPIRVVYEGAITGNQADGSSVNVAFAYYDFRDTVVELKEAGIEFHVYPARHEAGTSSHKEVGAEIHRGRSVAEMVKDIGQYRWGFIGNSTRYKQWDVAMPNKLFEYMAAGIPVIVWNAAECAKFVEREGVGIVVNSAKEIVERNGEAEKCRINCLEKINRWTWESNIHELEKLYEKVAT